MSSSHRALRSVFTTSRCVSPRLRRAAAAAAALLLATLAGTSARAEYPGFTVGPAHGQNGFGSFRYGQCATIWDPDGAGPGPALLVVAAGGGLQAWDGSSFISFGGLASGSIRSLGVYNGQLYVGGTFTRIGADVVNNVARWDGSHWQPLGTGMTGAGNPGNPNGSVNSLVVHGGVLCIGGTFVPASTGTWTSFATWDGVTLTAGLATQAPISQLAEINTQLFAATTAGVPGVYRYDTNVWTRFGNLADHSILTLTSYNDDLVCGGEFTHFFTGTTMYGVARWSGTQWVPMGGGLGPAGCQVTSLATSNGVLVAGGVIGTADGAAVQNVAQWNGTQWSDMAGGIHVANGGQFGGVEALASYDGQLVAMGEFDAASGTTAYGIARWNGSAWLPFSAGIDAPVLAMYSAGTGIYAGGDFQFDWGGATIEHGFGSDGTSVSGLGSLGSPNGTDGPIRAITLHAFDIFTGSYVIVGGSFSQAGGLSAHNIAAFSYIAGWSALGNGFNNTVNALANYGGSLYAAGSFTASSSGATTLHHLARYGSGGWADLGVGDFPAIHALAVVNGQLVIGGARGGKPFLPPDNGVSTWDGTTLNVVAYADGPVYALADLDGDIVAAGSFTSIGGVAAAGVAIRDHSTGAWSPMGSGFSLGVPYALAMYDGNLYAGGTFMLSSTTDYGRLAMWNGSAWVDYSGGVDGPVYSLAPLGSVLEIGGDFQRSASGVQSPYWIRYNDGVLAVDPPRGVTGLSLSDSWPNPARGTSRIEFSLERAGHARLTIHDLAGRRVRVLADGEFGPGTHAASWDGTDSEGRRSPPGLYFYRLDADDRSIARRVVLTR